MAACALVDILPDTACFTCLSNEERQAILTVLLCKILQQYDPMASCDPSTLLSEANDYMFLGVRQQLAVQISLLCDIKNVLIDGGGALVITDSDPVADPGVAKQIWFNRSTGSMFIWNDADGTWDKYL